MNKEIDSGGHADDVDLHLYVLARLSAAHVAALEKHVFHCPVCKERLASIARVLAQINQMTAAPDTADKRKDPRFRTFETGFLRSFAPLQAERWPVEILDISKNGLGLMAPVAFAKGSLVQVQVGKTVVLGEVRHSTPEEERFHVGIRLIDAVGRS